MSGENERRNDMLSKEQTIAKLNDLQALHDKLQSCFSKLGEVFGSGYFEGSLHELYCGLFDSLTDTIGECSGISQEALCWWIFDADWGKGTNAIIINGEKDNGVIYLTTNEEFVNFELGSE